MSKLERKPIEPLRTRHVFLDTEVYRKAGFNIASSSFEALRNYAESGRIVLHHADITLGEIHRQLSEMIAEKAAEAKRLANHFNRFSQIAGVEQTTVRTINPADFTNAAWKGFVEKLISGFHSNPIVAQTVPALLIFDRYFAMKPPFQKRGSKEFPDAFVVEALARFCVENSVRMYVVSGDAALRDAAESYETLIPLLSLDEVLAAATADNGANHEALVDEVFADPGFDWQLTSAIKEGLFYIENNYHGTLPYGSIEKAELYEIVDVENYEVAAIDPTAVGLIIYVNVILHATVRYLDEKDLLEMNQDMVTVKYAESPQSYARLKMYISIDLTSLRFTEAEMMTQELFFE